MYNFSVAEIDKCIESMNHRLDLVIRSKGEGLSTKHFIELQLYGEE